MLHVRKVMSSKPPRVIIYGEPGCGKSNFMINAPSPVILSMEDRVDHLKRQDGQSFDIIDIKSWDDLRSNVRSLLNENHPYLTVGIDSLDWAEKLCHAKIIGQSDKDIIRVNGGYGAGLRESEKLHRELIADLSLLREKKNMLVVATAHYQVKEEKNPEAVKDYDSFQIKLDDRVSSLWREWADAILFVRFNTFIKNLDDAKKAKAFTDHGRSVYATKQAFCQAKNVYSMPTTAMEFAPDFWNVFESYYKQGEKEVTPEEVKSAIHELIEKVKDEETKNVVLATMKNAGENVYKLNSIKSRLMEITQ